MFVFIAFFYASTTWGMLVGLIIAGLGSAGIIGSLLGYYWLAIVLPVGSGINLSAQIFELPSLAGGVYLVMNQPIVEIPMDDEERLMPVRVPMGIYRKEATNAGGSQTQQSEGLKVIEEVRGICPSCKNEIELETGEIYYESPFMQFSTHGYVLTPSPGTAPFDKAVIISPCSLGELIDVQDLLIYKGMLVMGRVTYLSLGRIFEMDSGTDFSAPCYAVLFSTWHVQLAQRLAGFTPAYMVPNREKIISFYNMWGITEAMKLKQQLATAKSRIDSLEANQPEFRMALEAGIAHERKQEELIDLFPRTARTRWFQPKWIALVAAVIISAVIITYLLTIGFK
ncbi:MAG: hypothetical protein UY55_C0005G0016 [Candidatus Jorgensenbacteria bacterium GW2011_GWB1_50_10]|nr:MAG: hypothetical protein UY55_C0005G0016 [Candidatus Jorgensenbacteria bacterium GW2011_GWB1_50_10]